MTEITNRNSGKSKLVEITKDIVGAGLIAGGLCLAIWGMGCESEVLPYIAKTLGGCTMMFTGMEMAGYPTPIKNY